MNEYMDGFVFSIPTAHLEAYRSIAEQVAAIWREHGALSYREYVADELHLAGTRSFTDALNTTPEESIIIGWVHFPSKEEWEEIHRNVQTDPRMQTLVAPLMDPDRPIFDASRMLYGGFRPLVDSSE